jgi:hypothetical protein
VPVWSSLPSHVASGRPRSNVSDLSASVRTLLWRWRRGTRVLCRALVVGGVLACAGAALHLHRWIHEPIPLPSVPTIDVFATLVDVTPTTVMTTVDWQKIPVRVPRWQFLVDHTLWLRMHFQDWDRLSEDLLTRGLERLLRRYGHLVGNRQAWRTMSAYDWDAIPQPIRAMATVGMIEYWVSRYDVGATFGLDREAVLRTIKAIAMSESWFEHRAINFNRDGSTDIGIGGASGFARRTIRVGYEKGWSDFTMTDDDYFNPWLASRWLAFWFDLMLQEANGDMDLAIRAYNRGIGQARAGAGEEYLHAVERRRRRYFEGPSDSPTWRALSIFRRQHAAAPDEIEKAPTVGSVLY